MKGTFGTKFFLLVGMIGVVTCASIVYSHCQIPCGIYGDPARFEAVEEHIKTLEKSIRQINELSSADKPNMNQIVRWVENKEKHADEIAQIVTYYFMAQRVKPASEADAAAHKQYITKITLLHKMLIQSMKAKQSADLATVEELRKLLGQFHAAYIGQGKS